MRALGYTKTWLKGVTFGDVCTHFGHHFIYINELIVRDANEFLMKAFSIFYILYSNFFTQMSQVDGMDNPSCSIELVKYQTIHLEMYFIFIIKYILSNIHLVIV